jgi:hypothetical protein
MQAPTTRVDKETFKQLFHDHWEVFWQRQGHHLDANVPEAEHEYESFVSDKAFARERLDQLYWQYPELFPASFE